MGLLRSQLRSHLALSTLLAFTGLVGCGDDSAENPEPTAITGGNGASTGTGTDGSGGSGGGSGAGCTENGCFSCEPEETEQFLNACTDAQCSAFDNEARLPLFNGGDLPPVP